MSSAEGYGGGGEEHMYHVPQQSRREKLRFPHDEPPQLLHDSTTAPPFYHTTTTSPLLFPTLASSSSSSYYYHPQNPNYSGGPTQFIGETTVPFPRDHHLIGHQGVSLSLSSSSSTPPVHHHNSHHFGGGGPLYEHGPPVGSRSPVPLGPFTGYSAVLNGSRFLDPARQLLEELSDAGRGGCGVGALLYADPPELLSEDHAMEGLSDCGGIMDQGEQRWKKTRLISMLDEVYKRYKQYYHQVQAVITSFESVAGLSTAAPYACLALKAMSKHFRCLKNAISDQLQYTNKALDSKGASEGEISGLGFLNGGANYHQRGSNNPGTTGQQHVWRPQRGLPERAVAVLRAWLFEHFLHPYPTDTDKQMLAKQTGLSRNQVSNWFINARVRLWKPMVEEIHSLEMRQAQKVPEADRNRNSTKEQAQLPSASSSSPSNMQSSQNTCNQKNQHPPSKRYRNDFSQMPHHMEEPFNFVYDNISSHQVGIGVGVAGGGGNGGVSLTLGLHQNNGVCLPEPLPLNVVRRFGLEECNDAYVMGAFEGQDRHFGKDIGGQLLHDFVG